MGHCCNSEPPLVHIIRKKRIVDARSKGRKETKVTPRSSKRRRSTYVNSPCVVDVPEKMRPEFMYSVTTMVGRSYIRDIRPAQRERRENERRHTLPKVLMQTTITDGFAEFCLTGKPMVSS